MIPKTFEEAFAQVKILVQTFQKDEQSFLEPKYQEAQVRQQFLDKFFAALGWDVYQHEHSNPYEREVKIEKSVIVQGRGKRADYAFYIAPNFSQARFMAEAKKPSRQLENAQDCFQAIRYGWNSNTPISVLTDFEQFLVLDSRYKPSIETATQRIIREKSFRYTDFADEEKFREVYYLFSREAVGNNSLETFAQTLKGGRGARQSKLSNTAIIQPIDEEFLSELDEQRVNLARAFKNRNAGLDGETLTEITQRTLDRLVFLRFLEDKLVEPDSVIDSLGKKSGSAWRDFIGEMPRLNQVYNGTLFRPHTILDNPSFAPDERAFAETRDWLARVNSPYDFNSIPIHILGSIYERFLGKTIEATGKRATVVDKPEVRKAGGVYYTPEYIVRYIVENTIGKLIEKKKPEEITGMRFADIACGSGSFLLGVFDYLIAYHVEYFSENKTRREKAVKDGLCRETIEGNLQLTIQYKREILLNNIYGVDLDAQAVEVAQLSLYLKLLEEETTATKQQFLTGFREQLLPKLDKNIVHGNSLIDYDIMDGMLFDTRELKQLNPMSFAQTFPEVFQKGGFDAIVGNPPYVLGRETFDEVIKDYFSSNYFAYKGKFDLYIYFTERALRLLKQSGDLGFIIPNTVLTNENAINLRKLILDEAQIEIIKTFQTKVFEQAQVETVILVFKKEMKHFEHKILIEDIERFFISQEAFQNNNDYRFNVRVNSETNNLLEKVRMQSVPLGDISDICIGIQLGGSSGNAVKNSFLSNSKLNETYKKVLDGKEINSFYTGWRGNFVHYGNWLHRKRDEKYFVNPKIMIRQIGNVPIATYDENQFYTLNTIYNLITFDDYSLKYILAILNCKFGKWFWKSENSDFKSLFPKIKKTQIESIPIRTIDFTNPKEKAAHDKMVELVEKMLDAKKSLAAAQTDKDKIFYERYCDSLDQQIDALVYELYGLTKDEIKIIEDN